MIQEYIDILKAGENATIQFNEWLETNLARQYLNGIKYCCEIEFKTPIYYKAKYLNGTKGIAYLVHPMVAIAFFQWHSPQFYLWCNDHIKDLIACSDTSIQGTVLKSTEKIVQCLREKVNIEDYTIIKEIWL